MTESEKLQAELTLALKAIPDLKEAAKDCGYALAVHGSLARDIDLIAVSWIASPTAPWTMIEKFFGVIDKHMPSWWKPGYCASFNHKLRENAYEHQGSPGLKPHGRLSYQIRMQRTYFDIAVIEPDFYAEELRDTAKDSL